MSFVIVSSVDELYGPTAISTEDSILHEQLTGGNAQQLNEQNSLTLSRRRHHHHHKKIDVSSIDKQYAIIFLIFFCPLLIEI